MLQDSDTECSSDDEICLEGFSFNSLGGQPELARQSSDTSESSFELCAMAMGAISNIAECDLRRVQTDASIQETVQIASNIIIQFLDESNSSLRRYSSERLEIFSTLVQINFIARLFECRSVFHAMGAHSLTADCVMPIIVCWVDVVLAKLAKLIALVSGGFMIPDDHDFVSSQLKLQMDDSNLRAAAQLPQKLQNIPQVISSKSYSPACKRLALRLMYAVFVMGPQLRDHNAWSTDIIKPIDVLKQLLYALPQWTTGVSSSNNYTYTRQNKLNAAMFLCLMSVVEQATKISSIETNTLSLRPQTLDILLGMIQLIMCPDGNTLDLSIFPLEDLDLSQTTLLRWGRVVNWCWCTWDDQRIANVECITRLTATWLYQSGTSFLNTCHHFATEMHTELRGERKPIWISMVQVLYEAANCLLRIPNPEICLNASFLKVLHRASWTITKILASSFVDFQSLVEALKPDLCRTLCLIFCLLLDGNEELAVKGCLLECLAMIHPQILRPCIETLISNQDIRFLERLEAVIQRSASFVNDVNNSTTSCSIDGLLASKAILEFLTVIFYSKTECSSILAMTSPYLKLIGNTLCASCIGASVSNILLHPLLTTLSSMEGLLCGLGELINEDHIWSLALSDRCDFVAAASVSGYLLVKQQPLSPFLILETWCYLRDVCLLILTHQFCDENERLAFLVIPTIFNAMMKLIQLDAPANVVALMIRSPWTASLCETLRKLLGDDENNLSTPFSIFLQKGSRVVSQRLVSSIQQQMRGSPSPKEAMAINIQLGFYSNQVLILIDTANFPA